MMRVGLVTFHGENFGSALQCYATKRHVEALGYICDVLNYHPSNDDCLGVRLSRKAHNIATAVFHPSYFSTRRQLRRTGRIASRAMSPDSWHELEVFEADRLLPKKVTWPLLVDPEFGKEYEWFIAGSDQIWGAHALADPFYLLDFAENQKKVALAASFGSSSIMPYNQTHYARSLSTFAHLSVREEQGARIVKNLIGRDVPVMPDPVTFLTREEWSAFASGGSGEGRDPYILAHFLDRPSEVAIATITLLAHEMRLPVVVFAYPREELSEAAVCYFIDGSPIDYVSLVEHAARVCTDSFHTTQLSITFDRDFLVFDRMYPHTFSQKSRIDTALKMYACEERLIRDIPENAGDLPLGIPCFACRRLEERDRIIEWLGQAMVQPSEP